MRYKLESQKANIKVMRFGLNEKSYHFMKEIIQNMRKFYWCQRVNKNINQ